SILAERRRIRRSGVEMEPRQVALPGLFISSTRREELGTTTCRLALFRHRHDQPLEKAIDSVVVDPSYHGNKVVLWIDVDHIQAVAIVHEGSGWCTRPLSAPGVEEIVDEAVGRLQPGRG